jgi:AraC-like DNA-binding protein
MAEREQRTEGKNEKIDGATKSSWLESLVREFQIAGGILTTGDRRTVRSAVAACAAVVPEPTSAAERLWLQATILEFVCRFSTRFHERFHRPGDADCGFRPLSYVGRILDTRDSGLVRSAFEQWVGTFFDAFDARHPPSLAERAARLIVEDVSHPWTLRTLAAAIGSSAAHLDREFRERYGVSIRIFQRDRRIQEGLEELASGGKVEAVSLRVGYRSKKNFYRALRQKTGLTPTAIRTLSKERLRTLTADPC